MAKRIHSVLLILLSLAVTATTVWVLIYGRDFYQTVPSERPRHELFRILRPAGTVGHGLGILGSAMVLLLLVYSLRKRAGFMQRWGNLRTWLRYHIFLGIAGPVLITLHTAFKVQGLVAVSYWSMVAVAVSGFFGRFLYQQIPRNVLGEALGETEIEDRREELLVTMADEHGLQENGLEALEDIALGRLSRLPVGVALMALPFLNLALARSLRRWQGNRNSVGASGAMDSAREWVLLTRRLHLFRQINSLFHYWHVFHKPFAVIMILVMIVHVAVAVLLGYTWLA